MKNNIFLLAAFSAIALISTNLCPAAPAARPLNITCVGIGAAYSAIKNSNSNTIVIGPRMINQNPLPFFYKQGNGSWLTGSVSQGNDGQFNACCGTQQYISPITSTAALGITGSMLQVSGYTLSCS